MKICRYHTYQVRLLLFVVFVIGCCTQLQAQNIVRYAGNGTPGSTGDGFAATAAQLVLPLDVTVDASGNAYIADWSSGRVRKVNASGIISTFAGTGVMGFSGDGGPASTAQIIEAAGVAVDGAGNVYIADFDNHRIRKVNAAGIISTYAGNGTAGYSGDGLQATSAQFSNPWGIVMDGSGNLYISDEFQHRVRKVSPTGIISTFAGTGTAGFSGDGGAATAAQISQPSYMAADAAGNIYIADYANNRIRKVSTSGIITTVAGNGGTTYAGDGVPATDAAIWEPIGIAVDAAGNMYINDYGNRRVRKVNTSGIISTIAGTGSVGSSGDGGPATAATFNVLYGIHVDGAQNIYIADASNMKIRKIIGYNRTPRFTGGRSQSLSVCQNSIGDSVNSLLAALDSDSFQMETWSIISAPVHGTASAAYTVVSNGLTLVPTGTFYTPATGYSGPDSFKVKVTDGVASDTTTIHITVSGAPPAISGAAACFVGSFTTLSDIVPGGSWASGSTAIATVTPGGTVAGIAPGAVVIAYTLPGGCVSTVTVTVSPYAGLIITTIAGNGTAGYTGDGMPATASALNAPYSMTVDSIGNVYIADALNYRIRKVNTAGIISTIAGTGTAGYTGDGSAATTARTRSALAIISDAGGNIYFADQDNHCIRRISTSGIITTVAGTGTLGFSGDGFAATTAQLYLPTGIAFDAAGNLYIADAFNHRVRKVNTSGIISTIAGNGISGYTGDGIAATTCEFTRDDGVVTDATGNVYVTDFDNHRIRRISSAGMIYNFAGIGSSGFSGDGFSATTAQLNLPFGIAIDGLGNIFSSDYGSQHIRKVNTAGIISTLAGDGTSGFAGDYCAATAAEFHDPGGVAVDRVGNIYIADVHNHRIRKISYNHAPVFIGGHLQTASMCTNSVDSVNILLAITDADNAQGETWSELSSPVHGSLVASYAGTSNGGTITPVGLYYTPTTGYGGTDSFIVRVIDCSGGADTTKIVITVTPPPSAITGTATVCAGLTTTFADTVGLGVWSSNNTAVATVIPGPAGSTTVTGVSTGTAVITYSPGAGCAVTKTVSVSAAPAGITGTLSVCRGLTTSLSDATPGGTWSSSASGIANVGTSGVVTGSSVGTANIDYTIGACAVVVAVTVNPVPTPIAGITSICIGATSTLSDGIIGGTWASGNTAVVTVDLMSGIITGAGAGAASVIYTLPTGCTRSVSITVLSLPPAISGIPLICVGTTTTLSDASGAGIWTVSGIVSNVSVDSFSGVVTGLSPGTSTVIYTSGTGCTASIVVTVSTAPAAITGSPVVCAGSYTYLSDAAAGGTWSSSAPGIATVDPATGAVWGISTGPAIITYSVGAGCAAIDTIRVNARAGAISGSIAICAGLTLSLTDTSSGGTWSSGNLSVATVVPASGIVYGLTSGTAIITYMLPAGCFATATVTINSSPGIISGTTHVCIGATTTLGDLVGGGTWSSSNLSVATLGSSSGIAGGIRSGTVTVTYSLGSGCAVSTLLTIDPLPSAISGTAAVCIGATTALTDGGGGTWACGNPAIATIGSATGIAGGILSGTVTVTYTLPTGCKTTQIVTVNSLPAVITGSLNVCPGNTTAVSSPPGGGSWVSGSSAIATVVPGSGLVTGVTPGTVLITYTASTGCSRTATVTVNTLPSLFAVSGGGSYCAGGTGMHITLSGSSSGVSYQLYNGSAFISPVLSGTGSGLDFGLVTALGTYTVFASNTTGCSQLMTGSAVININPLPSVITGPSAVCVGAAMIESDSISGGTWSSGTISVATVIAGPVGGGLVYGVATGTATITYTLPAGCSATKVISVSLSPVAIAGPATVCAGASINLTDAAGGGTWTSSNTSVATIGLLSGTLGGIISGTTTVTYSLGTGCTVTGIVTVIAAPAPITGTTGVCAGATTTLSDITSGGAWSSSTTAVATVSGAGLVRGMTPGIDTIFYTYSGCAVAVLVTVNAAPGLITGASSVCGNATITLADAVGGGTWTSSNTSVATIGTSGIVSGVNPGITTITYSLGAGCTVTKIISVNPVSPITGTFGICVAATTLLSDATVGGTWFSSNTAVATITGGGTVTGVSAGSSVITYTTAAGCKAMASVTVNTAPSPITGALHVCVGAATSLSNTAGGGTWTSGNLSVATVITASGMVTGVTPGTSIITYSLGSGCTTFTTVTVDPSPAPIAGLSVVCAGATISLSDATSGGTWGSGAVSIATITAAGVVSGASAGTATITYTPATGCFAIKAITVNPLPSAITGAGSVCAGLTVVLIDTTTGGTWSSGSTVVASITSDGILTGGSAGTTTITYTLPTACAVTRIITVNAAPGAISGALNLCIGTTTALSDPSSGGAWSSSDLSVATVNSTGLVTGAAIGTTTISYIVSGCPAITVVTVNSLPGIISGTTKVCMGSATILSDLPAGGTWSSIGGTGSVAIGPRTGVVSGVAAGTATVTYTLAAGCSATATVTVNPLPASITGIGSGAVCVGYTTVVSDATPGGVWSSSDPSIATVSATGIILGTGGGAAIISYTIGTGCAAVYPVFVTAVPPITGVANLCAYGDTVQLSDSLPGGAWSSALVTVTGSGVVTAHAAGVGTVTYTMSSGCYSTTSLVINPIPAVITGPTHVCIGTVTTLGEASTGGVWSSGATAVASVSSGGAVLGRAAGISVISYTFPATGCKETFTITVNPAPSPIIGASGICIGDVSLLSDTVSGGVWSSSSAAIATVTGAGTVTGVSAGTSVITYYFGASCQVSKTITVNPLPLAYALTGGGNYCAGTAGIHIGLGGSGSGVSYKLFNGTALSGTVTGTGGAVDFGLITATGVYKVTATNPITSCSSNMPDSVIVGITPSVIPSVSVVTSVGNTVCVGTPVDFSALPVNGGAIPTYQWAVNGVAVAGSGSLYSYTPSDNDVVSVILTGNEICAVPDTASGSIIMTLVAPITPTITLNVTPGTTVSPGQSVTITATVSNALTPQFVWYINGLVFPGHTTNTLTFTFSQTDTVTCKVLAGDPCSSSASEWVIITVSNVGVKTITTDESISFLPNPNKGTFTIKGVFSTLNDEDVALEITDMLGQVVYKDKVVAHSGKLDQQVQLDKTLANGMYLLSIHSASGGKVFHIVVEQ